MTKLRWGLRLLGFALVALVILTKVRWEDTLTLASGEVLTGRVVATAEGFTVRSAGTEQTVSASDVRTRVREGQRVPEVTYGFPTLLRRLGGHLPLVAALMVFLALLVVMTAWRWHLLVRAVDLTLPLATSIRLTFVGAFFNQAVPGSTGGDVVKAYYAAKLTVGPTRAVVSVFVDRFIGLFGLVVLAAVVLLLPPHLQGETVPRRLVLVILLCVAAVGLVFGVRRVRRTLGLSKLVRALPFQGVMREAQAAVHLYRTRPGAVLVALALSVVNHAGIAALVWGFGRALGLESLELSTCMALVPVCNLLSAIPVLPGGWGVGEWAFAYFFGQAGVPATEAVGLSMVYRLAMLFVSLPGGVLWFASRDAGSSDKIRHAVDQALPTPEALP